MSNRDLIPEARADKNGHIVVRWVKNLFGGVEEKSINTAPPPALSKEAKEGLAVLNRWRSAFSQAGSYKYYEDASEHLLPEWVKDAVAGRDLAKLQLVEKFADRYDPELISVTLEMLRNAEQGEADHLVSESRLDAMTIMDRLFPRTEVNSMDEDQAFPAMREERLRAYVLHSPEAAHKVEELTSRGNYDPSSILDTIKTSQVSDIPTPLNDGML